MNEQFEDSAPEIRILVADDNDIDVRFLTRAFDKLGRPKVIDSVRDGVEALDFLRKRDRFSSVPTPDILVLDLNMPRMNGVEVLEQVSREKNLEDVSIVVLSTADDEGTVNRVNTYGTSMFFTKPASFGGFVDIAEQVIDYWMRNRGVCRN